MIPGFKKRTVNFHDILMYVAIGRKHFRLMVLLICASLLFGLDWYVFARPAYQSKALIHLDLVPQQVNPDRIYREDHLYAMVRGLVGPDNTIRTARALGINAGVKTLFMKYIFKQTPMIDADRNLELEVWPNSVELARKWPEELVRQFKAYRQEEHTRRRQAIVDKYMPQLKEVTDKADQVLDQRFVNRDTLNVVKTQIDADLLHDVPSKIVRLQKRINDVGRVKVKLNDPTLDVVAKLSLIASLDDRKDGLTIGEDVNFGQSARPSAPPKDAPDPDDKEQANNQKSSDGGGQARVVVVPSLVKTVQQAWEQLDKDRQQIKDEIAQKSFIYKPGHHVMVELNKALEEVNRKLQVELDVASTRLSTELQDIINQVKDLKEKLPEYDQNGKAMQRIDQQMKMFEASELPWDRFYELMHKELQEFDYAEGKEWVYMDYQGLMELHDEPVSPNKFKIAVLSLLLGVMLALGIPLLLEYLDHTLSNLEQVESTFQMRGLGIVPKLSEYGADRPLLNQKEKLHETNLLENFRVIRTNLLSMGALSKAPHVIMVASAMPKEGKTVVSSNLAVSFSQTGARTLLIDTDLRRGRLHRLFGYRKSPGLSDLLLGECKLEEAIRPSGHENLSIVSAGKHIEAGTELLGSERFRDFVTEMRGKYDRIILDTPPVLGLSETSVLQTFVDGVLFVIWSGNTPVRTMKAAIEMLQANGANFYGFVLNRLDLTAATNYYQYYYYSYDYYYSTQQTLENT